MTSQTIEVAWQQLENWLAENAPKVAAGLNPGATEEELLACEKVLEIALPNDFKDFYRRHNGQSADSPWLFDGVEFLSLHRIQDEWLVWKDLLDGGDFEDSYSEPPAEVKNDWWNKHWIPFTYNGGGDHLCIDLDPTEAGTKGQVIEMWHDWEKRPVLNTSFKQWFCKFVEDVLTGKLAYEEEDSCSR
ncbi:Cell wall assembly/cell proliferation coordinating protein, KNR4 [[Leptolyngbya] sp. PCC 7376]|uniref:SMI1/KNR4 family protein n=1 Tax=[Leptolyngbya] sp. PCC 7376 TaxID=111781 RepID=UPI00029EED2A|nr:SMI1/KNR4 family protein [[Leptolyngbya] sp. PCC 7376]AFY38605.1 Cell wall assembly/cell proliferation coordinating protein, KNR4 [[Leptolyngbya] sp. PCC 7376]